MKLDKFSDELSNGVTMTGGSFLGGLHWVYKSPSGEDLSVILHSGSYGRQSGTFEIMPSWLNDECPKGDVLGGLSFGEVQEWIDKLVSRAYCYSVNKLDKK